MAFSPIRGPRSAILTGRDRHKNDATCVRFGYKNRRRFYEAAFREVHEMVERTGNYPKVDLFRE